MRRFPFLPLLLVAACGGGEGRSLTCDPSDPAACGAGEVCSSLSGTTGVCEAIGAEDVPCDGPDECRQGLSCIAPYRGADFRVCGDPTPPGDGTCRYDLHCGDGFCGLSDRCLEGSGDHCRSDEDCFDGEHCDGEEEACVR